jgi:glycosyltransferase involved in cell wall biosynthesis
MPTLSVIVPTRNRADLWRRRWLLDSLIAQTDQPDELVITLDHPEDDTLDTIQDQLEHHRPGFACKLIEVLAPRATPMPASGIPDNCAFHAAAGNIILHVDDDISLPHDFCRRMRMLFEDLPPAVIWAQLAFVDADHNRLPSHDGNDCRSWLAVKHHWQRHPGGLVQMPIREQVHWGAVFTLCARDLRKIGGHALDHCGWHNTDTRLGNRLARSGINSYLTTLPETSALHLGKTWYAQHAREPLAIRYSQGTTTGPRIANGGLAFWSSDWFKTAYREIITLDAGNPDTTIN